MNGNFIDTYLQKIKNFIKNHRKIFFLLFIFWVVTSFFDIQVLANSGISPETQDGTAKTLAAFIDVLNNILKIASSLIGVLTALVTLFLTPEWTTGSIFGLNASLKSIWVIVSNVVYVFFLGLFITIAFMNIIGKGENEWALKKALPRFFIGVMIVPFSWMIVQLIISVSTFLTVAALTLPYDNFKDKDFFTSVADSNGEKTICTEYTVDFGASIGGATKPKSPDTTSQMLGEFVTCKKDSKINLYEYFNGTKDGGFSGQKNTIFGVVSIYAYGVMDLDKVDEISYSKGSTSAIISNIMQLGVHVIINTIFVVMFLILLAAIFLVLFTRGVLLWLYAMVSPVFGVVYFFGSGKEFTKKFNFIELIKLAMVPVFVSLALSFGLLFIMITGNGIQKNESISKTDKIEVAGFTYELKGASNSLNIFPELNNTVGVLILQIFALLFLWVAVMAALKSSSAVDKVVAPIDNFGKQIGSLALSAPQYAPIIPGKDGSRLSIDGANKLLSSFETHITNKNNSTTQDWQRAQGFIKDETGKAYQEIVRSRDVIKDGKVKSNISIDQKNKIIENIVEAKNNGHLNSALYRSTLQNTYKLTDKEIQDLREGKNHEQIIGRLGLGREYKDYIRNKNNSTSPANNSQGAGDNIGDGVTAQVDESGTGGIDNSKVQREGDATGNHPPQGGDNGNSNSSTTDINQNGNTN